jgi:hypothetical protein
MMTICQPSTDVFASHGDQKSKMSLMRYAERTWPFRADDMPAAQDQDLVSPEIPDALTHMVSIKQFCRFALTIMLAGAIFAAIVALRSAKTDAVTNFDAATYSEGNVS